MTRTLANLAIIKQSLDYHGFAQTLATLILRFAKANSPPVHIALAPLLQNTPLNWSCGSSVICLSQGPNLPARVNGNNGGVAPSQLNLAGHALHPALEDSKCLSAIDTVIHLVRIRSSTTFVNSDLIPVDSLPRRHLPQSRRLRPINGLIPRLPYLQTIPTSYHDLLSAFSKHSADSFPVDRSPLNHSIDVIPGSCPPAERIRSVSVPKLVSQQAWIKEMLTRASSK